MSARLLRAGWAARAMLSGRIRVRAGYAPGIDRGRSGRGVPMRRGGRRQPLRVRGVTVRGMARNGLRLTAAHALLKH